MAVAEMRNEARAVLGGPVLRGDRQPAPQPPFLPLLSLSLSLSLTLFLFLFLYSFLLPSSLPPAPPSVATCLPPSSLFLSFPSSFSSLLSTTTHTNRKPPAVFRLFVPFHAVILSFPLCILVYFLPPSFCSSISYSFVFIYCIFFLCLIFLCFLLVYLSSVRHLIPFNFSFSYLFFYFFLLFLFLPSFLPSFQLFFVHTTSS